MSVYAFEVRKADTSSDSWIFLFGLMKFCGMDGSSTDSTRIGGPLAIFAEVKIKIVRCKENEGKRDDIIIVSGGLHSSFPCRVVLSFNLPTRQNAAEGS